ncbi:MAG: hypothetical protein IPL46_06700 [Saprospiraceae bacterium]|nr:hypothetical protein [Saprospiraceae bacterium]
MVTIWANEFDRSSKPACNSDNELSFRIELMDGVADEDFAGDADSLVLDVTRLVFSRSVYGLSMRMVHSITVMLSLSFKTTWVAVLWWITLSRKEK